MARHIEVIITAMELLEAEIDHPRELVQQKFLQKGFHVVNFAELKYFGSYDSAKQIFYFRIEGNIGQAILSK